MLRRSAAHEDFVLGQLEVVHFDFFFVFASRQKRGLVDQVFQVSPRKTPVYLGPS